MIKYVPQLTSVVMEESGLSHVINHQRIRANDYAGCRDLATIKVDYDPLSAYVEFRQVLVHHADGSVEDVLLRVYDYVAPARLIYWGASQKMVQIGDCCCLTRIAIFTNLLPLCLRLVRLIVADMVLCV